MGAHFSDWPKVSNFGQIAVFFGEAALTCGKSLAGPSPLKPNKPSKTFQAFRRPREKRRRGVSSPSVQACRWACSRCPPLPRASAQGGWEGDCGPKRRPFVPGGFGHRHSQDMFCSPTSVGVPSGGCVWVPPRGLRLTKWPEPLAAGVCDVPRGVTLGPYAPVYHNPSTRFPQGLVHQRPAP